MRTYRISTVFIVVSVAVLTLGILFANAEENINGAKDEYYPDGSLSEQYTTKIAKDGTTINDGPFTKWHENGKKAMEGQFQEGKLNGTLFTWDENGQKQDEENYTNGVLDGLSLSWEDDGQPFSRREFRNGTLISDEMYENGQWVRIPVPRDICEFSAHLTLDTRIVSVLYIVREGSVERICIHTMMRSPNAFSLVDDMNSAWKMTVVLGITEEPKEGGIMYSLKSKGNSRGGTSFTEKLYEPVDVKETKILIDGDVTQAIPEKKASLLYVEGTSPINANSSMTPEEFAKQNKGTFLLVTIEWSNMK